MANKYKVQESEGNSEQRSLNNENEIFPTRKYVVKNQELRNTQKLSVRTVFSISNVRSFDVTTSSYTNMNSNKNSELQVSERIIKD